MTKKPDEEQAERQEEEDEDIVEPVEVSKENPSELTEYWDRLKHVEPVPRLTDDELRKFIDDFVSNRIFTSAHVSEGSQNLLSMIFMPIAFGAFKDQNEESVKNIGLIYEYYDKAGPRSVNGYPIFFSLRYIHTKDWERARKVIHAELERRKAIELPPEEPEGG